jgi:hypothetical protein
MIMADNTVQDRYEAFFESDFMPLIRHAQTQGAEARLAYAAEFIAFKLGRIDRSLQRLADLMERASTPQP